MGAGTAAVMIFLSQNGNVVERYESRVYTDGLYQGELFAQNLCVSSDGDVALDGMQDDSALHGAGLFNMEDKEVVYGYHLYDRLYPASTTKILTAYIALKYGNMDDKVTVSANATDFNLAFDIAINGSNFFNIPFVTNFKYLNPHIHSNFTCKTIMVLDISNVSRDNEKNVSYFTVDSVSQSGEKYVLSNYRVEVEGTDISSEDVYAKFIAGQYSQFYKIKESNIEEYEDGENLDIGL